MVLNDHFGVPVTIGDTVRLITRDGWREGVLEEVAYTREWGGDCNLKRRMSVFVTSIEGDEPKVIRYGQRTPFYTAPFILIKRAADGKTIDA